MKVGCQICRQLDGTAGHVLLAAETDRVLRKAVTVSRSTSSAGRRNGAAAGSRAAGSTGLIGTLSLGETDASAEPPSAFSFTAPAATAAFMFSSASVSSFSRSASASEFHASIDRPLSACAAMTTSPSCTGASRPMSIRLGRTLEPSSVSTAFEDVPSATFDTSVLAADFLRCDMTSPSDL